MPSEPAFTGFSRRALLASVAMLPQLACGERTISVGGARFRVFDRGETSRRYIHIHGNEATARLALGDHVRNHEGRSFFVMGDDRNVHVGGLWIDPNRMFSRIGGHASLKQLNPGAPDAAIADALATLERDLPALLRALLPPDNGLLIAVHNNNQGYNIQSEIPISEAHHLPKPEAPNDFFLVTDARDFEVLERSTYNAVLQSRPSTEDDGSLSRLCASRGIRYVNLECYAGRLKLQREMLAWLDGALATSLAPLSAPGA
jgi:hypothetical protein